MSLYGIAHSGIQRSSENQLYECRVIDNADPEGLGRVKVEIPRKSNDVSPDDVPWLKCVYPTMLGGSAYTLHFGVPQVNTLVLVWFTNDKMTSGYVIGSIMDRSGIPSDPLEVTSKQPLKNPEACGQVFTNIEDGSTSSSPDYTKSFVDDESYPFVWGWIDNAWNHFKVNMLKRTLEFVTSSLTKMKIYHDGTTVVHIAGDLKVVVEGDYYLEVRGHHDKLINNNYSVKVGGMQQRHTVDLEQRKSDTLTTEDAPMILQNCGG